MASDEQIKVAPHPSFSAYVARRGLPGTVDPRGGGGDDGGSMEARLSEVEKAIIAIGGRLDRIGDRLDTIVASVNEVKGSVSSFKWQMFGATIAVILAVIATGVGIQQMTVSTFQAGGQTIESKPPAQPTIIVVPGAVAPSAQTPNASAPHSK